MARYIYCRKCGDDWKPHPEDTKMGCTARKVFLSTVRPEGHGFSINGVFAPLSEVTCDRCGEPVTGDIAHAVTIAPPGREIGPWEHEYGTVLATETVAVADKLSRKDGAK